ncbi:MAG: protein-L-isoaspartate(D-aspartate) O-methyltransferase [Bdellovibrionota bacterium]
MAENDRQTERDAMVQDQIVARGVKDEAVLRAMRKVPRHKFVPQEYEQDAYSDSPLPLGHRQTISQPYIVAFMSEAAQLRPTDKVLEIGTGSAYQTAVLAELAKEIYTIEIIDPLGLKAKGLLHELRYENAHVRIGDGYEGWKENAPFDVIFVTAAPNHIPEPLVEQLKVGGRFIIPVGSERQELVRIAKTESGLVQEALLRVSFVPMTGAAKEQK